MAKKRAKVIGKPPVEKEFIELVRLSFEYDRLKHELLDKLEELKKVNQQIKELEENLHRG